MARIYLSGSVSNWDEPFKWHESIARDWDEHDFINPYELNDFELGDDDVYDRPNEIVEPALESVESCDGLFIRWEDDVFLVGSTMEIKHAFENGVPVVIWNKSDRENLSPWILHTSRGSFADRDKALKVLLALADGTHVFTEVC